MISILKSAVALLDQLEVAICIFDADDRALVWNETFLQFFPEHAGHVHVGEDYRENLRRFYLQRLSSEELPQIERYIEEGVQRHRNQLRAFDFDHRDYRVRVASLQIASFGRVRLWRKTTPLSTVPFSSSALKSANMCLEISPDAAMALESLADGILMVDEIGKAIWANHAFLDLFEIPSKDALRQREFNEIYAQAWCHEEKTSDYAASVDLMRERQRFSGAPYVIALPNNRWARVVELRGIYLNGSSFVSTVDVTESRQQQEVLKQLTLHLESLAIKDALTGLVNRRRFDEVLQSEWKRACRSGFSLSLLMLDVDNFKHLNDAHGHPFGDEVLRRLAGVLSNRIQRTGSSVARYGGEEFAVLLPDTDLLSAAKLAEFVRDQVEGMSLGNEKTGLVRITISVGVACARNSLLRDDPSILVDMADHALYEAKRAGRNRIATANS